MATLTKPKPTNRKSFASRRKGARPAAISVSQGEMVKMDLMNPEQQLPLLIEPNMVGLKLTEWAENNGALIEEKLLKHGGILFRGWDVKTQDEFDHFVGAICPQLMTYTEGATPRRKLSDKVYTSTEFPNDQTIALHNELSYVTTFPQWIFFSSVVAAETGGETPIADVRRVYERVPAEIRERFAEKGWMLVRNFGDGFGPTWQNAYHIHEQAEAEAYFYNAQIEFEWKDANGSEPPEHLRTRQVRPAILQHPDTNEPLWFNHIAFWHRSSLIPEMQELLAGFADDELPYNTFYGDGSPIEDEVAAVLRQAYDDSTEMFPWQPGDVMMLDNALVAHGRSPFTGERRTLAAMGKPFARTDV